MATVKSRLARLEKATQPDDPPKIRIHWANAIDDGTADIYQDENGDWWDRETGEPAGWVIQVAGVFSDDQD